MCTFLIRGQHFNLDLTFEKIGRLVKQIASHFVVITLTRYILEMYNDKYYCWDIMNIVIMCWSGQN